MTKFDYTEEEEKEILKHERQPYDIEKLRVNYKPPNTGKLVDSYSRDELKSHTWYKVWSDITQHGNEALPLDHFGRDLTDAEIFIFDSMGTFHDGVLIYREYDLWFCKKADLFTREEYADLLFIETRFMPVTSWMYRVNFSGKD